MGALPPPSVALTALLDSLHTHLQTQTHLLPTLHTQLGLPPTALEDELTSLQQQLAACVEGQIDVRRRQVEEWLDKCDGVERECIRYAAALGAHSKVAGTSVAEMRKEQVLPRRYQTVTEHQEKLRQLYHTKLEQLNTITNRIAVLTRTLGLNFFPEDIIHPTPAGGESVVDPDARRDVTPERFSKLEKELVRGKGEVSKRLSQLHATMTQIDWLYVELGIDPPAVAELPIPSSSSLGVSVITRPSSACGFSDPFLSASLTVSTPTPSARTTPVALLFTSSSAAPSADGEYERLFARFSARLAQAEADGEALPEGTTIGLEGVEPTPGLVAWAERTWSALADTKRRREAHIQAMYDQLEALWRRLGVPDADMDAFVERHQGSTEAALQAYEEELERMMECKRERMGVFVQNARAEIERLWDELMVGSEERADFAPFADEEHTEELLAIHEEEIRRLKEERRMKAHLLASIRKYFEICDEERELAAAASDQGRLLGRGPRDPGRLLREEKMRKRVNKEKPRLEQDLIASIPAWEVEAGRPFLVHGEPIMQLLAETASAVAAAAASEKENAKRKQPPQAGRAGSVPARATTPSNANGATHYMPGKGAVTPAVRAVPSSAAQSQSGPNKRPRLGDATGRQNQGHGNGHAPPTSHKAMKTPGSAAAAAVSSLPRPAPKSASMHERSASGNRVRSGSASSQPHGHGHAAFGRSTGAPAVPPLPAHVRVTSGASAGAGAYRMYGAATTTTAVVPGKPRARRESFKPRPSVDDAPVWMPGASAADGGRWPGIAGMLQEEDEGYA